MYRGQRIAWRAHDNDVYAAFLVELLELEHHPMKAHITALTPEGPYTTVADYDPDLIKPGYYTDINVESWLSE